jgi:hypothetical protein
MTRRAFLQGTSALGVTGLFGAPSVVWAEPPPETSRIRLIHAPAMCLAPQTAEELLFRADRLRPARPDPRPTCICSQTCWPRGTRYP